MTLPCCYWLCRRLRPRWLLPRVQMVWTPSDGWERYLRAYIAAVRHQYRREPLTQRMLDTGYWPPGPHAKL